MFHATSGNQHPVFAFDIKPSITGVTLANFSGTSPATVSPITGGSSAAPYGNFPYALQASANFAGPLKFTASVASGTLTPTDLISNGHAYMTADIMNKVFGGTGNVAAVDRPMQVPEPGTFWIVSMALIGLGVARGRAQQRVRHPRP